MNQILNQCHAARTARRERESEYTRPRMLPQFRGTLEDDPDDDSLPERPTERELDALEAKYRTETPAAVSELGLPVDSAAWQLADGTVVSDHDPYADWEARARGEGVEALAAARAARAEADAPSSPAGSLPSPAACFCARTSNRRQTLLPEPPASTHQSEPCDTSRWAAAAHGISTRWTLPKAVRRSESAMLQPPAVQTAAQKAAATAGATSVAASAAAMSYAVKSAETFRSSDAYRKLAAKPSAAAPLGAFLAAAALALALPKPEKAPPPPPEPVVIEPEPVTFELPDFDFSAFELPEVDLSALANLDWDNPLAALAAADAEGVLTGFRAILYVPVFVGTFVLALPPGDQAALFVALLAAAVASGRKS